MAKYDPLRDHLVGLPGSQSRLTMSFSKVEELLGEPLPRSALEYEGWWQGKSPWGRVQRPRTWEQAGWVVDQLDLRVKLVTFRRQD
ncbi:MAG: hypothetical protein H0V51_10610 [Chloroflexi bacterium]|nr:hypothetical protein [Chloroflexota bacterium]